VTEGPYKLPKGWRWVRLGEILKLRNGRFIRKSELTNSGTVRVYGANGLVGYSNIACAFVTHQTIIIGRVGACASINWALPPAWVSDNAMWVSRWLLDCEMRYVYLFLKHLNLGAFAKHGAQPSISQQIVYDVAIPLPPLAEQRRIVAHLEAVQERVQTLKKAQEETEASLKELERSILDKAFRGEL